jgi:putative membrane protein
MMWGPYGGGYGFMGGLMPFMGIFWLVILILIGAAVMGVFRGSWVPHDRSEKSDRRSTGLVILAERYARGEINRDEYLQMKKDIQE